MIDVKAIEERLAKATPGPWKWATTFGEPDYDQLYADFDSPVDEYDADIISAGGNGCVVLAGYNADFIAHSWQDVRDLLATVRELTGAERYLERRASASQKYRTALEESRHRTSEVDQIRGGLMNG